MQDTVTIQYVWNRNQGEWSQIALVDHPKDGRYFYRVESQGKMLGPVATRLFAGGPVIFRGNVYSQHARGERDNG
jgi:hypothetical protein